MKIDFAFRTDVAAQRRLETPVRPDRAEREVRPDRPERASEGVNYRNLYNRVVNSDLEREEKAGLINRIQNAAGKGGPVDADPTRSVRPERDSRAERRFITEA